MRTASRATRPTPTAASKSRATSTSSRVTPCSTSNRSKGCPRSTRRRRHRASTCPPASPAQNAFSARPVPRSPTAATVPSTGHRPTASCYRSSKPSATPRATTPPSRTRRRTGPHESRLARDFGTKRFGSEGYAIEGLVAELGAAFLCADLDLTLEPREDYAAYIANWLDVLKADSRAIFTGSSTAQHDADFVNGPQPAPA